jgi:hypothetical protein
MVHPNPNSVNTIISKQIQNLNDKSGRALSSSSFSRETMSKIQVSAKMKINHSLYKQAEEYLFNYSE